MSRVFATRVRVALTVRTARREFVQVRPECCTPARERVRWTLELRPDTREA